MARSAIRRILNNKKHHRNWLGYLGYKYFGSKNKGFEFVLRNGSSIKVPRRMLQTYKECFFDETYRKGLPASLDWDKELVVVDIGANVGYFSLFMLSLNKGSRVFAYEPMPVNFKQLEQYKQAYIDWNIFNAAVSGDGTRTLVLNYDKSDEFTTSASISESSHNPDSVEVPCTSLEQILTDNELERIDFLKVDCEGSEYSILYNAGNGMLDKVRIMAIETHVSEVPEHNTKDLNTFLEDQGFSTNMEADIIWAWRA